jgi:protein ImuB
MYACIYSVEEAAGRLLLELALEFSPAVEQTDASTVVFSIDALRRLIGSPYQIASDICLAGHERKLQASLAIASNPDAAILLARNCRGVTLVTPGEERLKLAPLPLAALFTHDLPVDAALLNTLQRWGLKTCEDLAALPERGVAERLGKAGIYLRSLACGAVHRPLRVAAPVTNYEERMELEHPLQLLETLLFLLGRVLSELCGRLHSQSRAARLLAARFELEGKKEYSFELEFAVPLDNSRTILKLLQLHMERHPLEAALVAFTLRIEAVEPRRVQGGIFLPPTPPADKLQMTLARIAGMVGKENVGTPRLLDTHRPDAFEMANLPVTDPVLDNIDPQSQAAHNEVLRLAMRLFRPALQARVHVVEYTPRSVLASGVRGNVIRSGGPWKTSGEWWTSTAWSREEWDVALDDGALYRIYQESKSGQWYVHGVYD